MKKLTILLFLFIVINSIGQEKRTFINGIVKFNKEAIFDVHVINKNTNKGTLSNQDGFFETSVKVGDSLYISHLNYKKQIIIITQKIIRKQFLNIKLEENTNTLEGFTLEDPKTIFDIYNNKKIYQGPKVTAKSLGLPFARTAPKKEKAIIKINSGAVLSVDNLINVLNGNNRRARILKKLSKEDEELKKIRKHYTDNFFVIDLMIREQNINPFLNFCVKDKIIRIFKQQDFIKLTEILIHKSKIFPQKLEKDSLAISKK